MTSGARGVEASPRGRGAGPSPTLGAGGQPPGLAARSCCSLLLLLLPLLLPLPPPPPPPPLLLLLLRSLPNFDPPSSSEPALSLKRQNTTRCVCAPPALTHPQQKNATVEAQQNSPPPWR